MDCSGIINHDFLAPAQPRRSDMATYFAAIESHVDDVF
jgi:hypothetical protein